MLRNKDFIKHILALSYPIFLQNLFSSLMNMTKLLMVGQLGDTAVAAVGLVGQITFVLSVILFGASSGGSIFFAQFWGARDTKGVHKALGVSLSLGLMISALFTLGGLLFPEQVLGVFSQDVAVIDLGSQYLRILAPSYLILAVIYVYSFAQRSTGQVKLPMRVSILSLLVDILLAFGLIFGNFGFPKVGILGGAVSVLVARFLEGVVLVGLTYRLRTPIAASLREMFSFNFAFVKRVLRKVVPVMGNELMWSTGITIYTIIFARISTEAIATYNIMATLDNLGFAIFMGLNNACAIVVGQTIGLGDEEHAQQYAWRAIKLQTGLAVVQGLVYIGISTPYVGLFRVSETVHFLAVRMIWVLGAFLWLRVTNAGYLIGALRSGGDTRFAYLLDIGSMWLIGVPLVIISAFVFHLPVYLVYLAAMVDELFKFIVVSGRFRSKRWIHNVVRVS
jgi:putative MATE family efflux protein